MKILFTTHQTSSHLHPLVPLAQALQEAGHEIAFASTPRFVPTIEASGFHSFPTLPDETHEERQQRREQMAGMNRDEELRFTMSEVFAGTRARRTLPYLLDIIADWHPDLVVRENSEFAGCVAAERSGIPHAVVQITSDWPFFLDIVEAPLARLCEMAGLPPTNPADLLYHYLLLSPRPLSLWNPAVPIPPTAHAYRYAGFSQSGQEGLPAWVSDLKKANLPTVYATLGTFDNNRTDILAAIPEALRDEPLNLILTVGRNRDPAEFGPQPSNVHVERYIPQNLLLPYCDLALCHGGSGTIMDTLSLGLPLVIVPIAADQPENAQRCMDAGVARIVEPDPPPPSGLAYAIRDATREVLTIPAYRQAAQRLCKEIEELPGLDYVVTLLERLAVERTPITALL